MTRSNKSLQATRDGEPTSILATIAELSKVSFMFLAAMVSVARYAAAR
jgi:hypothetical protein